MLMPLRLGGCDVVIFYERTVTGYVDTGVGVDKYVTWVSGRVEKDFIRYRVVIG